MLQTMSVVNWAATATGGGLSRELSKELDKRANWTFLPLGHAQKLILPDQSQTVFRL